MTVSALPEGLVHVPRFLERRQQESLVAELREVVRQAPFFVPAMPRTGKPMSVRMTNCGSLGWVSDRDGGYRYQPTHPRTGKPWPPMPQRLLDVWMQVTDWPQLPEACLVNFYDTGARMGLHQDRDEEDLAAPVVSLSLGDTCLFRIGGTSRGGSTRSLRLESGDLIVLGGPARMLFHGVDRIYAGTSDLLPQGGRINLTLRRVSKA